MLRDALLSDDRRMRYWLLRQWSSARPLVFILLNPSTADASKDDATVRKCYRFAVRLGYGSLVILNLFPFRATDPAELKCAGFPNDATNDEVIKMFARDCIIVCGWGANARGHPRVDEVMEILRGQGCRPHALRLLKDGTPEHPLFLPGDSPLIALPCPSLRTL